MSRTTFYQDQRLTLVGGTDHVLGTFLQLFDNEMIDETPEGEGLIYGWSKRFGTDINLTGNTNVHMTPFKICEEYVKENKSY